MMGRRLLILWLILGWISFPAVSKASHPLAQQVVVLANSEVPQSVELARHYQNARGVPETNIITLAVNDAFQLTWPEFVDQVWNPLLSQLIERKLVSGTEDGKDALGRLRLKDVEFNFTYLLVCKGIPVVVAGELSESHVELWPAFAERFASVVADPSYELFRTDPRFQRDDAAVDGMLSLLLVADVPVHGLILNPMHRRPPPVQTPFPILRITRLDGPDFGSVRAMIDNALLAERKGLRGRAYIDMDTRGEGFAAGNQWLDVTGRIANELGFDTVIDRRSQTFAARDRLDAPVLYFGWYTENVSGPFALPGFRFPPGAIAMHIHSFSAQELHNPRRKWSGPLINAGVTATVGNTAEPFLPFTHHPDALLLALVNGLNFADAVYFSLASLAWQNIALGDPLYTPFAVGLEQQIGAMGDPMEVMLDQYVALRHIRLLERELGRPVALAQGRRYLARSPGPALALQIARWLAEDGKTAEAVSELMF
ncbi:MAG: TIGR03790 family protein [Verrucomicrobia bacterium]|nr:TIGR03790 family protein [Verrucomicrobiota bacterium]